MTKPSHIFILGAPRSGSTLLQKILNTYNDIRLGGESHFLGHMTGAGFSKKLAAVGDIKTDAGAEKIVDHIFSTNYAYFWEWIQKNVDREEFLQRLLNSGRRRRDLLNIAMQFHAEGKPIIGEKTPAHIHHLPTLLDWYPRAKVIHTFRDPRAIFVSKRTKKAKQENVSLRYRLIRQSELVLELYLALNVVVSWLRVAHLHTKYQQIYSDRYFLLKYEDLVIMPNLHLERLCKFLGIEFNEGMLQQTVINSSFTSTQQAVQGFDTQAVERWRDHIHPLVNRWITFWCKKQLQNFDYQI